MNKETISEAQLETLDKLFDLDRKIETDEDLIDLAKDFDEDE